MAKKQTGETEQTEQTPRRGRQPGQESNPENSAKRLSQGVARAVWFLSGSPTSAVGVLAARAAKQGISRERVEKGLSIVQDALELARVQMEAAYAAPTATGPRPTRPTVDL